jgi:DNA-binding transcriptional regulator YiaG
MRSEEIKQLRKSMRMSQQAFATELGIGIATVSRWELGKCKPSPLAEDKINQLKDANYK